MRRRSRSVRRGQPSPLTFIRPSQPVSVTGVKHKPHQVPERPTTVQQTEVLALLSTTPQGATALGHLLNRSTSSVSSSLYALQRRGLAVRVVREGWRRA